MTVNRDGRVVGIWDEWSVRAGTRCRGRSASRPSPGAPDGRTWRRTRGHSLACFRHAQTSARGRVLTWACVVAFLEAGAIHGFGLRPGGEPLGLGEPDRGRCLVLACWVCSVYVCTPRARRTKPPSSAFSARCGVHEFGPAASRCLRTH